MDCKEDKYRQLSICSCNMIRRSARKITQFYDLSFREVGIKSTQFSILATLANLGAVPITKLAAIIKLERTGLTRNLNILERNGWVDIQTGEQDSRLRVVSLTEEGYKQLDQAIPYWEKAQNKLKKEMGADVLEKLKMTLVKINTVIDEN